MILLLINIVLLHLHAIALGLMNTVLLHDITLGLMTLGLMNIVLLQDIALGLI